MTSQTAHDLCQLCSAVVPTALVILALSALLLASFPPGETLQQLTTRNWIHWWFAAAFALIVVLLFAAFVQSRSQKMRRALATGTEVVATP